MKSLIALLLLSGLVFSAWSKAVNPFPGEEWSTGYLTASDEDKALFYYLIKCRNKSISNPPLMIWLEGGPGYSSAAGIYMHGGPYIVNNMTGAIVWNKDAWNSVADVLFVDQPAGTIFSYSNDYNKICADLTCIVDDLQAFLRNFFAAYPQYRSRDYYITGISYGGHYVPAIGERVQADPSMNRTFKGVLIFNGFYDVFRQAEANSRFLFGKGLVGTAKFSMTLTALAFCKVMVRFQIPVINMICGQFDAMSYTYYGLDNDPYNVEQKDGDDPYETTMKDYLNRDNIQSALGVRQEFATYNWTVFDYLFADALIPTQQLLVPLLNRGLKVYMVHGDADFVCSHLGGIAVAHSIEWDGQKGFEKEEFTNWVYKGSVLGQYKGYKNLKYVRVNHVGHSMFYCQREFGLEIIKEFLGQS